MMKPATQIMSYQNSPLSIDKDDDAAALLLGTTILPPPPTTMTTTVRSFWSLIIIVVAGMLLLAVAGGTVGMLETTDGGRTTTTTAEGLVVVMERKSPCLPASREEAFGGVSVTNGFWGGRGYAFETCYQLGNEEKYCWSKSWYGEGEFIQWFQCVPKPINGAWHDLDPKYVLTPGPPVSIRTPIPSGAATRVKTCITCKKRIPFPSQRPFPFPINNHNTTINSVELFFRVILF